MSPDLVNGLFEGASALFQLCNVFAILKDKQIRGVRIAPTFFFLVWGLWNLFYYPHLGQSYSLIGGLLIVSVNIWWLILMFKYRGK